jgi:hypothetical protein
MDKTEALKLNKGNFDKHMKLSKTACDELHWWINSANSLFKPVVLSQPEVTLFTDASSLGWGGVLDKVNIGGRWTPSEANHHINYLEMLAVFFALKAFQTQLCGKHVCIRIDNMTAVSDIGKMGTSHSRKRNNLTREIWNWCIKHGIFITTAHIPGAENVAADAESRKVRDQIEWALDPDTFKQGTLRLGVQPVIDLFASRLNYKLKPFVAYQPDPEAVNAFTISWKPYLFYAFPPFSIITLVLQKIREEQSTGLLVVPNWPTQPWWPYLMRMVIQNPVVLPKTKRMLVLPTKPDLVHPLHPKLTLLMCHISGDPLKIKDFRKQLYPLYHHHGGRVHKGNTNHTLSNGNSTVVQGNLINFQQL